MQLDTIEFLIFPLAYLIGAIPTSVWVGKLFFDKDVRDYGSGNAGATNTIRVLGPKVGIPVLFFDILKGFAAVSLILLILPGKSGDGIYMTMQILLGVLAVIGHIFPVYAGFKGGKGVATLLGIILAIVPVITLITAGVFIVTLLLSKYVSLSSISSAIAFAILVLFIYKVDNISMIIFSILAPLLVVLTHKKNIHRLLNNEESKVKFFTRL